MRKLFIILGILIIAAITAFFIFKPSKPAIDKEAVLEQRDIHVEFRETGEVRPRNRLEIKPPFAGELKRYSFKKARR